jgi:hypothetical protein
MLLRRPGQEYRPFMSETTHNHDGINNLRDSHYPHKYACGSDVRDTKMRLRKLEKSKVTNFRLMNSY